MHEIVHDREDGAGRVDAERHPPEELLVEPLLEVLQYQQADRQTGQRAGQMRYVRDRRAHLLGRVSVVDREPHVGARWKFKLFRR